MARGYKPGPHFSVILAKGVGGAFCLMLRIKKKMVP